MTRVLFLVAVLLVGCTRSPSERSADALEKIAEPTTKHQWPLVDSIKEQRDAAEAELAVVRAQLASEKRADSWEEKAESWKSFSWKQGKEIVDLRRALAKAIDKKPVGEVTDGIPWFDAKYEQLGVNGRDSGYVLAPSVLGDYQHPTNFPNVPLLIYNGTAWHVTLPPGGTWTDGSLLAIATAKPGEQIKTIHQWIRMGDMWEQITADQWSCETLGVLKTDEWTINGKTYKLVEVESGESQESPRHEH